MTDVKRWIDDGAPDAVRTLFTAAREEAPSPRGVERTLVALGFGSAALTALGQASGAALGTAAAAKAASGGMAIVAVKWGVIGAVAAVSTLGAVYATSRVLAPPTEPVRAAPAVPRGEAPAVRPLGGVSPGSAPESARAADEPSILPAPEPRPLASPAPPVSPIEAPVAAAPFPIDSPRMLEEVRAIDRARSALARGDAAGTLAAVDAYAASFPEQRFAPEALFLRMEAHSRFGDVRRAHEAARRLLASHPNAPQAARARRVLAGEP